MLLNRNLASVAALFYALFIATTVLVYHIHYVMY